MFVYLYFMFIVFIVFIAFRAQEDEDKQGSLEISFTLAEHRHGWIGRTFKTGKVVEKDVKDSFFLSFFLCIFFFFFYISLHTFISHFNQSQKLMSFKKGPMSKAMLKKNRDIDKVSVESFKQIQSYMGDRRSSSDKNEI